MDKELNLDFDNCIDRQNTDSLKYDGGPRRGKPAGVLPLWVADMDFATSSLVLDEICERTRHGIFGYTEPGYDYFAAVSGWMDRRYDWQVNPEWLVQTPGVVFALATAVKVFTEPGDAVLIQQPVYYPFSEVIRDNGRQIISNDLILRNSKYQMDLADFEEKIVANNVRLFFLCSPHNPVGRVWSEEELLALGEICLRHGVIVVSDEIHADFVYSGHRHQVFAALIDEFADNCITCTSPGKTFNLAGLQVSNIFIKNRKLRQAFKKQIAAAGYSQMNTLGLTAAWAAYTKGGPWYEAMLAYLEENKNFVSDFIKNELPQISLIEPEGTYLLWMDFRGLELSEAEREDLLLNKAGLWLDSGAMFGTTGEGFERINIACPRATLEKALNQLKQAIDTL